MAHSNFVPSLATPNNTTSNFVSTDNKPVLSMRQIPCRCVQCDESDWGGISKDFLDLIESGREELLTHLEAEWRVWKENRKLAHRPVWTAEDLLALDDRICRAQIASSEGIDISCERTRFILRDLADEGFWGKAAFDRLTPNIPPEKPSGKRRIRKRSSIIGRFDLFGDFGLDVHAYTVCPEKAGPNPFHRSSNPFHHSKSKAEIRPVIVDEFGQSVSDELWKQRDTSLKHWPREVFRRPSDRVLMAKPQENPFYSGGE